MTREEGLAWRERWREVNRAELEELRMSTPEADLRALAAVMDFALSFPPPDEKEDNEVRARWVRVKRHALGG